MYTRWRTYQSYLLQRFGEPVYRIGVDGGFSCPNRDLNRHGGCSFCDGTGSVAAYQRRSESGFTRKAAYSARVSSSVLERIGSVGMQIERGKEFVKRRYKTERFSLYFQSFTNTYDSAGNLKRIYDNALSYGPFSEFIVSTRPDCLPDDVLDLLASYITCDMDVWVELGLQSADNRQLDAVGRGHTAVDYIKAAEEIKQRGMKLSTHVILGLPGEGRDGYLHTADAVNSVSSDAVKIHNLHVTGGTRLQDEFMEGCFTTSSEERSLESAELFLRHLSPEMIVQRLVCETPYHRLVAPRAFPDKSLFLSHLERRMCDNNTRQGDLYET